MDNFNLIFFKKSDCSLLGEQDRLRIVVLRFSIYCYFALL